MQKIFRAILFIAILSASHTVAPRAFACSCIEPPAPQIALAKADAVFVGRVVSIFDPNPGPLVSSADPLRATFQVTTVWKGAAVATLNVVSARNGASCGFHFEQGREYLIYAQMLHGELETNICTRSAELNHAQVDVGALGAGQAVATARVETFSITPWLFGACVAALLVALVAFGSGLVMFHKRET